MTFNPITLENWERKEYFNHYLNQQTTFSMTTDIEISSFKAAIKRKGYKFYPTFIYMVTEVINANESFRISFNEEGKLGYWEKLIPLYTVFDDQKQSFSNLWTDSTGNVLTFQEDYDRDVAEYNHIGGLFPKTPIPANTFPISMIPWNSFSGFNLNVGNGGNFLLPIITAGKYYSKGTATYLPVSLQVHHAVCDGYHAASFMNQLQELANTTNEWL
ncbi:type A chloramphenicol O-acetyltransferase [Geomicrobium sp. JCM 19038]|uniref:type A chloramphenicol O-acetyltransferase n=1 Tax=Geomicrobium sp. JCM 19038 TaxID=1460635 RepID=UPI00045F3384|nr:type A chloramphenicol O-acetyltransferase [Geomicrobium sp. JCM 19038]GAK09165.1 chloramphenicol acetyltransferase [Geomicrobium sp. JCM 19038]